MKLDDQTLSPLMDELSYLLHHLGFASYFDRITRTEAPSTEGNSYKTATN